MKSNFLFRQRDNSKPYFTFSFVLLWDWNWNQASIPYWWTQWEKKRRRERKTKRKVTWSFQNWKQLVALKGRPKKGSCPLQSSLSPTNCFSTFTYQSNTGLERSRFKNTPSLSFLLFSHRSKSLYIYRIPLVLFYHAKFISLRCIFSRKWEKKMPPPGWGPPGPGGPGGPCGCFAFLCGGICRAVSTWWVLLETFFILFNFNFFSLLIPHRSFLGRSMSFIAIFKTQNHLGNVWVHI